MNTYINSQSDIKSNADNAHQTTTDKLQTLFNFAADCLPDEALLEFADSWQAEEKAVQLAAGIESLALSFSSDDKSSLPTNEDVALVLWALKEQANDIATLLNLSVQASDILARRRKAA